jgi:hypothetical protein
MNTKHVFLTLCGLLLFGTVSFAQVKIGDNPGTLATGTVLDVEKSGEHVVVSTSGNVGIGTTAPNAQLSLGQLYSLPGGVTANGYETFRKITLQQNPSDEYGIGITAGSVDIYKSLGGARPAMVRIGSHGGLTSSQGFYPAADNYMSSGRVNNRWSTVFGVNGNYTGNVSIGTSTTASVLSVASSVSPAFQLADGTQGAGKVLVSDASGYATWQTASAGAATGGWSLSGNAGTTAGTNFLGTTDAQDLVFKTGGTEQVRTTTGGFVGIGTAAPNAQLSLGTVFSLPGGVTLNGFETYKKIVVQQNPADDYGFGVSPGSLDIYKSLGGSGAAMVRLGRHGGTGISGFYPAADNALASGRSTNRWSTVFGVNGDFTGNVGIGTTAPATKLEVNSGTSGTSGLRLTQLTSASTPSTLATASLGITSAGDVVVTGGSGLVSAIGTLSSSGNVNVNNTSNGYISNWGTLTFAQVTVSGATYTSGVFTVPSDGLYLINTSIAFQFDGSASSGYGWVRVLTNESGTVKDFIGTCQGSDGGGGGVNNEIASAPVGLSRRLKAGDTITIQAYLASTNTRQWTVSGPSSYLSISKL